MNILPNPFSYFLLVAPLMVALHEWAATAEGDTSGHRDSSNEESGGESSGPRFVAILVVANVIVLVVIFFLLIIYYKKYNKLKNMMRAKNILPLDKEHDSSIVNRALEKRTPEGGEKGKVVFVDKNEPEFELNDLFRSSAEGLGRGNFGNCYKAMMEIGRVVVVKRLIDLKPLSSEEFVRQVKAIADQKHSNLLPLLAYYYSKEERLFLYRFAAHGNLFNRLHGGRGTRERVPFRWSSRLAAARGVARALEHLHRHTRSEDTAPHGNLKSSNVLFDEDEEVLVCDFGLTSLVAPPIAAQRMVAYRAPEYQSQKRISKKSDVWSYGCLVLELLTGRVPAHSAPAGTNGVELCGWVNRAVREEWTAEIFDPEIVVSRSANPGMLRLLQIAMKCCDAAPEKRPEIGQVVAEVEKVKVAVDSEDEELAYSSLDRSLTGTADSSYSASSSVVIGDDRR